MITVIGGIKGGSGKTTLCTNLTAALALKNHKVLLVDADEQRSSSAWVEQRESFGLDTPWTTIQLFGSSVRAQLLKLKENYDYIFVDTGGRDTTSQRAALTVAETFIAPFQPRSLDVWTLGNVNALIAEIRAVNPSLIAYAVINRSDPTGSDTKDSEDILRESQELSLLPVRIGQRKAFASAAAEGRSVFEMKAKDQKAIQEMTSLVEALFVCQTNAVMATK